MAPGHWTVCIKCFNKFLSSVLGPMQSLPHGIPFVFHHPRRSSDHSEKFNNIPNMSASLEFWQRQDLPPIRWTPNKKGSHVEWVRVGLGAPGKD